MKYQKTLLYFSIQSILLVVIRIYLTGSLFYGFLLWNLFLAFIPYKISRYLALIENRYVKYSLLPLWLLFLPNAPYILTDYLHLFQGKAMPIWFDFMLISSFTITGMLFFFLSINGMFLLIKQQFTNKIAWFFTVFVLFLSSFGVYLGRYLRWNSWDIIHKPHFIFYDVFTRIIHPTQHLRTWIVTFGLGSLFLIGFIVLSNKTNRLIK